MNWQSWIAGLFVVLALAGSKLARRSLVVLCGMAACVALVVWLFMPAT